MKNTLRISVLLFLVTFAMNAQGGFEITPQYGYQINSKINFNTGDIKIPGSGQFGVTVGYNIGRGMAAEFSWTQQNSDMKVNAVNPPQNGGNFGDIMINHYQFGAVQHFGNDEDLRPFFGVSAGWSTFSPDNTFPDDVDYLSSTSTFTFGLSGGIKYMFTNHIGLRVQSQLLLPVYYGGSYFGYYGYTSYSKVFAMLNFSGGLIFAFGDGDTTTTFN